MELVYLWVEKYKNIVEEGFNFSPKFECKYDKDSNELTIDENEDYISIFPDNINVTAIVGENGSGKSAIIENIFEFLDGTPLDKRSIIIYKEEDNYICITDIEDINTSSIDNIKVIKRNEHGISSKLLVYNHIYEHSNRNFRGYTTIEVDKKGVVNVLVFHYAQSIDFHLSDFMYQPNKIKIKYKDNDSLVELFKRMSSSTEELLELYNEKEPFHQFLIILCARKGIDDIEFYHNKEDMIERIGLSRGELTTLYTEFTTLTTGREFDFTEENKINIKKYTSREYFDLFDFDLIDVKNRRYNDLSHGEQVLFGLLLNIFFYSKNESKIFLLDEPELSLHPQWQKGLLNQIIKLLEQFTDNKYQLIVTSHSPFLLSDLPKENAIFLVKGKQKYPFAESQTFGANIHTLLSGGFFMNNGLMGEFAKEKIEEIKKFYELVKILKNKQFIRLKKLYLKRKKKFRHIKSIIGEPFLQTIIKNYLDELEVIFNGKKQFLQSEIKRLQELESTL